MDDNGIRAKLREAFRIFALSRTMPAPGAALQGFEVIVIKGGRNKLCSVCGEIIPMTAEGSFEFKYPVGRVVFLHDRCERLWQEERVSPARR